MKPLALLVAILVLPRTAIASSFPEFEIPDHTWSSWRLGLGGRASSGASGASGRESRGGEASGSLLSAVSWGRDAEHLGLSVLLDLGIDGARRRSEVSFDSNDSSARRLEELRHDRSLLERWRLAGELRPYPWQRPFGLSLRLDVGAGYQQSWASFDRDESLSDPALMARRRKTRRSASEVWSYGYHAAGTAAFGYGRVRDATGVYQAYILERRLSESGSLARPLSEDAKRKLAGLFYAQPRLGFVHDRPDKFIWREIERVLREDGSLAGEALGAYDVLRLLERLDGSRGQFLRRRGWFVGPSVGAFHDRRLVRRDDTSIDTESLDDSLGYRVDRSRAVRWDDSNDAILVGGEAEWRQPLGWRSQFDLSTRVLFPTRKERRGLNAETRADFVHLVADRWSADAALSHARLIHGQGLATGRSSWSILATASLGYYVEDRVRLGLRFTERQGRSQFQQGLFARDRAISLDLTYHLQGRLEAPGLMEPMGPMPALPLGY